ncbi:MAG TPA: nucleotidyltransferase family protein [Candidatus Faecousia intestinigallinarum]|nr:nucleotidyltransferase family protein [Candidatus Faecousia intestinigallinarum]
MNIGCIVMAAGQSRRFGGNKLLADLQGRPLLAHTLENIPRDAFARLLTVVSDQNVAALCHRLSMPCLCYPGGMQSETVRQGLSQMLDMDGCLFLLGDQPLCSASSIRNLLNAFRETPEAVCRLAYCGRPGSPVLFPKRLFPGLLALTGEQGGMAAARGDSRIRFVEALCPEELWDADTPEALCRIAVYKNALSQGIWCGG